MDFIDAVVVNAMDRGAPHPVMVKWSFGPEFAFFI
jgi:hypothetical protein